MQFYPAKVYAYFSSRYVLGKRSPKGWYAFDCPFCGKAGKSAVSLDIQFVKCWSCGAASNVLAFVQEVEQVSEYAARELINTAQNSGVLLELVEDVVVEVKKSVVQLPEGFHGILEGTSSFGDRARRNLAGRGFDLEVLAAKGFGYCNKRHEDYRKDFYGYIIVPFRLANTLTYYIGRDFVGNTMRYKNPPSDWVGVGKGDVIYNEAALWQRGTVFVLEGWSDAELIGKKAVATLGWSLSPYQLDRLHKCNADTIVFIPDGGYDNASGQTYYQKAVQIATGFIESKFKVKVVDLNPLIELGKDVCEIGLPAVRKQYKQTPLLTWGVAMDILIS